VSSASRFRDRHDAGRQLGERLNEVRWDQPVVLGLARGGVPVAFEVARMLHAPLDVLVVRKLGVPSHRELAFGAIAEGDALVLNSEMVQRLGLSRRSIRGVIAREREELSHRVQMYRADRRSVELLGRSVIIVDDGLATGATAQVAVKVARSRGATRIMIAVPVSPRETMAELRGRTIEVTSLKVPSDFRAVGEWYEDFDQTSDLEVTSLLTEAQSDGQVPHDD
jgi:putative phosphoribosyl transferase